MPEIYVQSMISFKTKEPRVSIYWPADRDTAQLSPEEARDLALNILQAAEAAEQDAFMFDFAKTAIKVDDARAAMLINEYRKWRGQPEGPEPKESE